MFKKFDQEQSSGLNQEEFNKLMLASTKKAGFSPDSFVLRKMWEEVGAHTVVDHEEMDMKHLEKWLWQQDEGGLKKQSSAVVVRSGDGGSVAGTCTTSKSRIAPTTLELEFNADKDCG